jgi:hypothetical protein
VKLGLHVTAYHYTRRLLKNAHQSQATHSMSNAHAAGTNTYLT